MSWPTPGSGGVSRRLARRALDHVGDVPADAADQGAQRPADGEAGGGAEQLPPD
jgi:hypothetical protein